MRRSHERKKKVTHRDVVRHLDILGLDAPMSDKGPCWIDGAEEQQGLAMARKRTHKRYLRQHHLGKFKRNRA